MEKYENIIHIFNINIYHLQIIDFYAINTGLSKVRAEIIVAEKRIGGVRVGHYQTFNNYVIVPKDVTSTDLNSSKICKIQYVLRVIITKIIYVQYNISLI